MIAFSALLSAFFWGTLAVKAAPFVSYEVIEPRQQLATYDYIVVGAGTAGGTVASRLAEDPGVTVLLIEAGKLYVDIQNQSQWLSTAINTFSWMAYDWNFTTIPQTSLNNRQIGIPAGKVVGGTSVLNGMLFDRGAAADYNAWADLGNPGWDFKGLLPYFKKSETFTPPSPALAAEFGITWDWEGHGNDGPIYSSYPNYLTNDKKVFFAALNELGIPTSIDGAGSEGRAFNAFWAPNSLHPTNMSRSYTRTGYYDTAIQKSNFHVILQHQVTQLVAGDLSVTPVHFSGVEYAASASSPRQTARATKEIIVSAGVVGSPRVLQLSGIGRKSLLENLNIPVAVDLPGVGSNYQDHGYSSVFSFFLQSPNAPEPPNAEQLYLNNRTGPWTNSAPNCLAFIPLHTVTEHSSADSIVDAITSADTASILPAGTDSAIIAGYQKQREVLSKHLSTLEMGAIEFAWGGGSITVSQAHPLSRGSIEINSADPFVYPTIDLRYFSDPLDYNITTTGFRYARRVMATKAARQHNPLEFSPGAQVTTDEQFKTFIGQQWSTMFHSSCSNPMQPRELGGVVDPELKVYGTANLRVVDASIFPLIPGSHPQATTYAVAEKGADLIKASA